MDSRQFPGMEVHDPAGYKALLGAPFPRLAWHTPVEVEINGTTYMADDGVVDLGPGIHASKPGLPHGCDFTLPLAQKVMPDKSLKWLADNFEVWGRVRVLGSASRYVQ
jgi:hypothetical protein